MKKICFILGFAGCLGLASNVHAASLVVTNAADAGPGSLRTELAAAASGDTITFAGALSGQTIGLAGTLLISANLTIDASALPGGIQINGNGTVTAFNVASNTTVVLNSLTITNAYNPGNGGGIYNNGTLTLNQCTLVGNTVGSYGGAIFNNGSLMTLNECTLSANYAAFDGGGIFNHVSTAILNECTLSGNSAPFSGGGIYNNEATVALNNTIISGNTAHYGGDIYTFGTLTYGGANLVQSNYNGGGTITGPAPLTNAPALAPLGNYGGSTPTMPPVAGSPSIGAGSVSANIFATDQRGHARTHNGLIDIGAVELPVVQPFTASPVYGLAPLSVQFQSTNVDSDGNALVQWTWSFGDGATGVGQNAGHTYNATGLFLPGLVVTNTLGLVLPVSGPAINVGTLVINPADSGPGTLRSRIASAIGGETIYFAANLSGAAITLTSTLAINTNLTIDASALPSGIQINGNGGVTVFNVPSNTVVVLNALTITNGYSAGNGGGISNNGTLTLNQSTLAGNHGLDGGAIYSGGKLTLNECTLSANGAGLGGGIFNNSVTAILNECTFSGNSATAAGGGFYNNGGTLALTNTIIAGNGAPTGPDIYSFGALTYGGANLVQSNYNGGGATGPAPLTNAPALAPLGNYGGPTPTMPPVAGSPAIGAGSVSANIFATDQRGHSRTQNGLIDIGAVESPTVPPFTANPAVGFAPLGVQFQSTNVDSDGSAIIRWNWSFGDGTTGALQNTNHTYNTAGRFPPSLIVTNVFGLALAVSGPTVIDAAEPLVTNIADSGPGTLRSAISNALNGQVITFSTNLSGAMITLSNTLSINTNLTVDASALPAGVRVNGNGAVTVLIVASNTTVTLNSLTITNGYANHANPAGIIGDDGGGILNFGTLTLNQCALTGNSASGSGGGVKNSGALTLNQCVLSGNSAVYLGAGAENGVTYGGGPMTLNECTLSGNNASSGGGISVGQNHTTVLNECTLSGNTASSNPSSDSGGGIYNYYGTLVMTNTIVAGNISPRGADIANSGALVFAGANLVQSVSNTPASGATITGPAPLTNAPNLAPLGNYGGPTQTMPPLPGSPAIGAGSAAANTFATDQRGFARTQDGLIDIGAVELPTVPPFTASPDRGIPPLTVQFNSTNADSDGSPIVRWNWSFGDGNASTVQNPTNFYQTTGSLLPSLIVTNSLGLALAVSGPAINLYPGSFVTNTADMGLGTLRLIVNSATNGEVITFATNLSGATITLATALTIDTNLTIDASALSHGIRISGNGTNTIFVVPSSITATLNSLTITNGYAGGNGGGISNNGALTLNQCILTGNSAYIGGGIYSWNGTLTLNECALSGNSATYGGGIYNDGDMGSPVAALNECTLSGNTGAFSGGGIYSGGTVRLNGCTLTGNSSDAGGGAIVANYLTMTNSIVAGNSALGNGDGADFWVAYQAQLTYGGSNLVQIVYNHLGTITGPNPINAAPNLARLGNYGGPAPTRPPLPGSPAIGAGSVAANNFATDQRGYARTQNGLIDIGAVELPTVPHFTAYPTNDPQSNPVQFNGPGMDSDGTAIVQWNWTFGDGTTGAGQNPIHVYATTGGYSPALIVTNSLGLTLTVSGPAITVSQAPPTLTGIRFSGTNLTIQGGNATAGTNYIVLASTNLALPLSQWTALETNSWTSNGAFSLTLTNAVNPPAPKRFYLLRVQ